MSTTNLSRTFGTPTSTKKWTWASWIKVTDVIDAAGADGKLFGAYTDASNYQYAGFNASKQLAFFQLLSGSDAGQNKDSRVYMDPAAWYHIVCTWDSANATSAERMNVYINGEKNDPSLYDTHVGLNTDSIFNASGSVGYIGAFGDGTTTNNFPGYMAHTHFCDGYLYDATAFGEVDSTSGIWVPKTSPSVTYGNNGFFLKYAEGALGTDSSGNGNNFTVNGGVMTSPKDCPADNYCVFTMLDVNALSSNDMDYTNIMTTVCPTGNNWKTAPATMGQCTGKFYFEVKFDGTDVTGLTWIGILDPSEVQYYAGDRKIVDYPRGYGLTADGEKGNNNSEVAWASPSFAQNDICCVAVDLTNSKIYFRKNGDAWLESGDPTSGSTGTGSAFTLTQNNGNNIFYVPAVSAYGTSSKLSANFGAGYFGQTAVASAGTNASGVGTFEFDVPTGYTAFSTKGLNI